MIKARLLAVIAASTGIIAGYEGHRLKAYRDPVGIPTICFGSTRGVKMGDVKTAAECKALLTKEIETHLRGIDACIMATISDQEYVAYTSVAYNVGVGAFCNSTLNEKLNQGDRSGACAELSKWVYAGGDVLPGLVKRRAGERQLCEAGLTEKGN